MKLIKFGNRIINVDKILQIIEYEYRSIHNNVMYSYIDIYMPGINENGYIQLIKKSDSEDATFDTFKKYMDTFENYL
jgi:hypothetical protein